MRIFAYKRMEDTLREWDELAPVRFKQISSGADITYRYILCPKIVELAAPLFDMTVLDAGCGVGILSDKLADAALTVTAIDPSPVSVSTAAKEFNRPNLQFIVSTIEEHAKGHSGKYDRIIANMSLSCAMDLTSFLAAVVTLMTLDGVFVFSLPHPCFWPEYYGYAGEPAFCYNNETHIEAPFRITADSSNSFVSTHIHRPLSLYFNAFYAAGLQVRSIIEPLPDPDTASLYPSEWGRPRYLFGACDKRAALCGAGNDGGS